MNYILVGRNGKPSMSYLFDWIIEDGGDISLIRQLSPKERKMKGKEYSITDKHNKVHFVTNIVLKEDDVLIRWGSRAVINDSKAVVINTTDALKKCSNKALFRREMVKKGISVPFTVTDLVDLPYLDWHDDVIIRPETHRAGKDYYNARNVKEAKEIISKHFKSRKWYASEFINKESELRVQYAFGKIISIKSKPKPDKKAPKKGPWNFSVNEDEWTYIPWGKYNLSVVQECVKAAKILGIDVCAFDVMVDYKGKAFILEANTAPSLSQYTLNRYSHLFRGLFENKINPKEHLDIESDNPKDYVWKNKNLNIKKND